MKKIANIHERPAFGAILTMIAGSIDAYTFILHGEVFAGLQTGNLILFGVNLGEGHFTTSLRYALSLLAFFIGTLIIRMIQRSHQYQNASKKRRQLILLYELALLLIVALLGPYLPSLMATLILSIAAAAELQEFRILDGSPFTPLMMTGNLRTLAETTYDAWIKKDDVAKHKFQNTSLIMITFALGAALVTILIHYVGALALLLPVILLLFLWWLVNRFELSEVQ